MATTPVSSPATTVPVNNNAAFTPDEQALLDAAILGAIVQTIISQFSTNIQNYQAIFKEELNKT